MTLIRKEFENNLHLLEWLLELDTPQGATSDHLGSMSSLQLASHLKLLSDKEGAPSGLKHLLCC